MGEPGRDNEGPTNWFGLSGRGVISDEESSEGSDKWEEYPGEGDGLKLLRAML